MDKNKVKSKIKYNHTVRMILAVVITIILIYGIYIAAVMPETLFGIVFILALMIAVVVCLFLGIYRLLEN